MKPTNQIHSHLGPSKNDPANTIPMHNRPKVRRVIMAILLMSAALSYFVWKQILHTQDMVYISSTPLISVAIISTLAAANSLFFLYGFPDAPDKNHINRNRT
jgi:hypothetical protein